MLKNYFPILIFIGFGFFLGVAAVVANAFLTSKRPDPAKNAPYECGFSEFGDARLPFDVRFYLIAILFILFDLETAFLFPWAVSLHKIGWFGFGAMAIFLVLLIIGFIYEWKKGGLEWE